MAVELLGGAVFTLLYDGVKQAIGKTGTFKYLLKDIKSTLESLNKLHATAIRQIGEYNLELGLPNDDIEELKKQMEEGAKLVGKLSDFRVWNYCCLNCYTDQLVDLDRSLKRLLENLKLQETRDVKEILDLLRKYRVELDELKGTLQILLQQRAGDVKETTSNSTAGSSTETMPQQNVGNGEEQGGANLRAVYMMLFNVVTEVKDKTLMFRPLLGDLKSMLDSLEPLIKEIDQYNSVLVLPKPEVEKFRTQMDKGVELVRKCSKVRPWTSYKKYNYTIRLIGLNESVRLLLSRLREQVAGEVSETLASISNLKEVIKQYEGPSVIQNQHEIIGSCKVPEPSSPTLMPEIEGSDEVHPLPVPPGAKLPSPKEEVGEVSETLASISNLKEVVKQYEGPSGIQNQHEIIGSCKVPEHSSPTGMPEIEDSVEVHPLPVPPGAKLPSPKVLITSEPESQPMKGQWQKGNLIGRGTFGNVYVASNGETAALCAMKEVDFIPDDPKSAECMKQLQQEIKVLSRLKHPNIVQYYGTEIVGDRFFIYQEYVHPVSINRYIQEYCGAMTEAVVRSLTHQIVSGLAYLHSTETIHGDIKGDNLLVESSGVVKIADFGIVKHLRGRLLKGGPYWMAPEIIKNGIPNDKCSDHDLARGGDIWSLGCTVIELFTGKPPWSEFEQVQAMFLIVRKDPPIPETLSPEGKDFLTCCLQRNPAERPTAAMLLEHPFLKNSQPQDLPTMIGAINLVNLMDKHKMTELQSNLKEDLIVEKIRFSTDPSIHHCGMSLERGKEFSGGEGSSLGYSSPSPTDHHDQQQQPVTLSRHEMQKRRDWNTFGQYLKNQRPPVPPSQCNYSHVLEFLRYLDQFGKTKVHLQGCVFYGQPEPPAPCTCPLRQAWGSLEALIGRLRAAYEENGGAPESNPFASGAIRGYLREVREYQAKARGIPYNNKKKKPGNSDRDSSTSSIMHFT